MASPEITSALSSIEPASGQQAKSQLYNNVLTQIVSSSNSATLTPNLITYLDSILDESIGIVTARPLFDKFIEALTQVSASTTKIEVGRHALSKLQARSASFEEQDSILREMLADAYEEEENYVAAAKALQGIKLDTSQRLISDEAKVKMWIRIIRLYIEEDDMANAELYLNKIKNMPNKIEDQVLKIHFSLSQAKILDARRRFLDASQEYWQVSLATGVDEADRLQALSASIICAVLAPAGPQRARTLGRLYKDDRSSELEEYGILEKIYLDRLLSPTEVQAFSEKLQPHQLAQTADGSTVLDKAMIEHNLLAASRLYENIGIDELGAILGLKASGDMTAGEKAEEYAARMVEQERLKGRIDQIEGVIYFDLGIKGVSINGSKGRNLRLWDVNVQRLAEEVERVATGVVDEFPQFESTQLVH